MPDVHRIELYVEPWCTASIRTAERAGHARECLIRSHHVVAGRRVGVLLHADVRPAPHDTRAGH